jgi:hypothetical protein
MRSGHLERLKAGGAKGSGELKNRSCVIKEGEA